MESRQSVAVAESVAVSLLVKNNLTKSLTQTAKRGDIQWTKLVATFLCTHVCLWSALPPD